MKKKLSLSIFTLFFVATLIFPLTLKGEDITFTEVKEIVFRVRNQCVDCHGDKLSYWIVKRSLTRSTEEDIRDNAWYPVEDCGDVLLNEKSKNILLQWIEAGMPE